MVLLAFYFHSQDRLMIKKWLLELPSSHLCLRKKEKDREKTKKTLVSWVSSLLRAFLHLISHSYLQGTQENAVKFFFAFWTHCYPQKYWGEMDTEWATSTCCDMGGPKECPKWAALKSRELCCVYLLTDPSCLSLWRLNAWSSSSPQLARPFQMLLRSNVSFTVIKQILA